MPFEFRCSILKLMGKFMVKTLVEAFPEKKQSHIQEHGNVKNFASFKKDKFM